jgi:hypothetical protein
MILEKKDPKEKDKSFCYTKMRKLLLITLFFYCVLSEKETKKEDKQFVVVEHNEVKYGGPPPEAFTITEETTETEVPTTVP